MSSHSTLSPQDAADRLALRELFDAYARFADARDAKAQMALFTANARFSVFMDGPHTEATSVSEGRESLAPVFADLNRYEHTMHLNGQSTVVLDGSTATGDSYAIAHHVYTEEDSRPMMVAWLHYFDRFTKIDHGWYIAERQIILIWSETRPLGAPTAGWD